MSQAKTTANHDEIRRWAAGRAARPSGVRTGKGKGGILRFDFGETNETPEKISYQEFFRIFGEKYITLLHRTADGETSRFFNFVERDGKKR